MTGGFEIHDGWLSREAQEALVEEVRAVVRAAPMTSPVTPWGKPMSVAMTSAGRVGWITDKRGYRYEPFTASGTLWPPIPPTALEVWRAVSGWPDDPDCCLVNFYREGAKMGLHQDKDEGTFTAPVVSISLGDDARFRLGGIERTAPTRAFDLRSGDVTVMGSAARLAFHGVDRIKFGTSLLLEQGGRINLTMRVVKDIAEA